MKHLLLALSLIGALSHQALAQWVNGQAAQYVIGQSNFTSSSTGTTNSLLNQPHAVAIDQKHGKLYVADYRNHRVLRFKYPISSNQPTAELVFGQPNMTSNGSGTGVNTFLHPSGLSVEENGRLWVCDHFNSRVIRFDSAFAISQNQPNADGVLGQSNFTGGSANQGGSVSSQTLNQPRELCTDKSGNLIVADFSNNRVLIYKNAGKKANGAAADIVLGQASFNASLPAVTQSGMKKPYNVGIDANGSLFISDHFNNRVLRFDNAVNRQSGDLADGVLGQADFTTSSPGIGPTQLRGPYGIAVDCGGNLYVSDYSNYRVVVYYDAANKPNGGSADAVIGQPDLLSSYSGLSANRMACPTDVSIDGENGNLFITDYHQSRILIFKASKALCKPYQWQNGQKASAVLGQKGFTNGTLGTNDSTFNGPWTSAIDYKHNKLYVSEYGNRRVLRYAYPIPVDGAKPELVFGQPDFESLTSNNGGPAKSFSGTSGLAVDPEGRLWVADLNNHRVLRFDSAFAAQSNQPSPNGVLGQSTFTGIGQNQNLGGPTASTMDHPIGICLDDNGNLYVADQYNNRILRFNNAASKSNGAAADSILGQDSFTTEIAATTQKGLHYPAGIAINTVGDLVVSDYRNNRVMVFLDVKNKSNSSNADLVIGQDSFTHNTAGTSRSTLREPYGIATDAFDRTYISDYANNRILIFDSLHHRAASTVIGQPGFSANSSGLSQSRIYGPLSLMVDDQEEELYVADAGNHRILRFKASSDNQVSPGQPSPYALSDTSLSCHQGTFCLPIIANDTLDSLDNCIGFNIHIEYDPSKVLPHPSSSPAISFAQSGLINPSYAGYSVNASQAGRLIISIYLQSAPFGTRFMGQGLLACLSFSKKAGFSTGSTTIKATRLRESFYTGPERIQPVDSASVSFFKDSIFHGTIMHWKDKKPMGYLAGASIPTAVMGMDTACSNAASDTAWVDALGQFSHSISRGQAISILRDVPNDSNVLSVIGGWDAYRMKQITTQDPSFFPSVMQLMAADVTQDGKVQENDISMHGWRRVLSIKELPHGRDWVFVDSSAIRSSALFNLSNQYPKPDGLGAYADRVPLIKDCLPLPVNFMDDCPVVGTEKYIGILLGDVDGNFDATGSQGKFKRQARAPAIVFDLDRARPAGPGMLDIPVWALADGEVHSLDFTLDYRQSAMEYVGHTAPNIIEASANEVEKGTLLYSSFSLSDYGDSKPAALIRFRMLSPQGLHDSLFVQVRPALVNGKKAQVRFSNTTTGGPQAHEAISAISIYPNPTQGTATLAGLGSSPAQARVFDTQGRMVLSKSLSNGSASISLGMLPNGLYHIVITRQGNTQALTLEKR